MVRYTSGTDKGETKKGDVFNDPFRLGKVDKNFTSADVVEHEDVASGEASSKEVTLAWGPVVKDVFGTGKDAKFIPDDGSAASFLVVTDGKVTITKSGKIAYRYNNEIIPQNDLPVVNAEIKSLPLIAKARRVAVYYSQIAAFQA